MTAQAQEVECVAGERVFASGQSLGTHADFKVDDALEHSKLFDAYPDVRQIQMSFTGEDGGRGANYKPGVDWISLATRTRSLFYLALGNLLSPLFLLN